MDISSFNAFVISLKRTPGRLRDFQSRNAHIAAEVAVFDAFDGLAVPSAVAIAAGVVAQDAVGYTPGAIGCGMSHTALWRRCAEAQEPMLIFEDDAVVRRDFTGQLRQVAAALDPDWDIVLLGYNCDTVFDVRMTDFCDLRAAFSVRNPSKEQLNAFQVSQVPAHLFRLNNAFGNCGYLLSPKGARILLERCLPMDGRLVSVPALGRPILGFGIDSIMNTVFRDILAYACFPPLVMVENEKTTSATSRIAEQSVLRGR